MSKLKDKPIDYFARAKGMVLSSFGRLPTPLVLIFLFAVAISALTAAMMQFGAAAQGKNEFMPQRIKEDKDFPQIDLKVIQGNWVYQTPQYAMSLTLIGDRFEWIIAFGDILEAQFYARGNYRVLNDVLILGVRPDLGKPSDPSQPWLKFMPIAMKDLNTKFTLQGKYMRWDVPHSEQKKILSYGGQIFKDNPDADIEWVKQ